MSKFIYLLFFWALVHGLWAQTSVNPEIRVRFLDYKTGRPIQQYKAGLIVSDKTGQNFNAGMTKKTDKDGIAVFELSTPVPPKFFVAGDYLCSVTVNFGFSTSEILRSGLVAQPDKRKALCTNATSIAANAQPGEIVLYVRRLNPWLKFRRFWWEVFYG